MDLIFILLILLGLLTGIIAWYRDRRENNKHFSWLSIASLLLPLLLIMTMYSTRGSFLIYTVAIGSPLSLLLCGYTLFKRREKKILAVIGLILSLISNGIVFIIGTFVITNT
ncbi:hypothetical protein [Fictibacillus norfolkensis]|uniref:Uncharacterized protein n=1 Tax=Fictibacillus norfolkensis TaxID=2762233 RepID=A0ABR8SMQ0_9BACL|nr:hypothetical protein [Fictibacillus norfolkensis]MBD7964762.1 hypothetical protein [Fictibacillus norfolkensis]